MSQQEMKQRLDNSKECKIPVVGGIINWWSDLVGRWHSFIRAEKKQKIHSIIEFILSKGLIIILIAVAIFTVVVDPKFISWSSIVNIVTQTSGNMFMALGIAGIILLTGTDLSAGRIAAFLTCIVIAFMQTRKTIFIHMGSVPFIVPLLIVVVIGAGIGFINGFFVAKFKLHSFIVTLSVQFVMLSVIVLFLGLNGNNAQSLSGVDDSFYNIMNGGITIAGVTIKWIILYGILATIIVWFIWNKTRLGKNMYAVGCNQEAATVSGISVFWITIIVFSMAGVLYGISAFVGASWSGAAGTTTAQNAELYAIAACVIGGVSFSGGVGKISGVVFGVFMIQMLRVALQYLQGAGIIEGGIINLILGAVILLSVVIDMRKYLVKR